MTTKAFFFSVLISQCLWVGQTALPQSWLPGPNASFCFFETDISYRSHLYRVFITENLRHSTSLHIYQ